MEVNVQSYLTGDFLTSYLIGHLTWISKTLTDALTLLSRSLTIEPRIYITGPNYPIPQLPLMESGPPSPSSLVESEKDTKDVDLPLYSALKLIHGRPSIRKLLHDEISASPGPVSVDGMKPLLPASFSFYLL